MKINMYDNIKEIKIVEEHGTDEKEVNRYLKLGWKIFLMKTEKTNHFTRLVQGGRTKIQPFDRFITKFILGKE